MPRKPRIKSATNIYHIVIKGIDRQIIFEEKKDYNKYIELLELYKEECHFKLFAYCLMSNHVHLLLQTTSTSLETIFRKLNSHYATWFNMKYQRTGHVQDGRFYSEPIEDIHYLFDAIRYVHFNPTKAGLEPNPGHTYPWSSIYEYKSNADRLVNTKFIYSIFDENLLLEYDEMPRKTDFIDVENIKRRIPDDVATDIMQKTCNCKNATEFLSLSLVLRNNYLNKMHEQGISVRQLNRITGVPLGVIYRVVSKGHSS